MGTPAVCWMEPDYGSMSQVGMSIPNSEISIFSVVAWSSRSAYTMGISCQMPYNGALLPSLGELGIKDLSAQDWLVTISPPTDPVC